MPDTEVPPIWNPEFFGNCMVVNGRTWPFLDVEPRRYRFRVLNGCNARFLVLRVDDPRVSVWKIGNEAGYLPAALSVRDILLAPAERADLVIDFSRMPMASTATLLNRGPDSPFGGGGFRGVVGGGLGGGAALPGLGGQPSNMPPGFDKFSKR